REAGAEQRHRRSPRGPELVSHEVAAEADSRRRGPLGDRALHRPELGHQDEAKGGREGVTRIPFRRIFWLGAAGILILAALVGIAAVGGGDFSDTDARILITLAALLYARGAGRARLALPARSPGGPPAGLVGRGR